MQEHNNINTNLNKLAKVDKPKSKNSFKPAVKEKPYIKYLAFFILVAYFFLMVLLAKKESQKAEQFNKWVECLNKSDLTDADCEICDSMYNKSKTFNLSDKF